VVVGALEGREVALSETGFPRNFALLVSPGRKLQAATASKLVIRQPVKYVGFIATALYASRPSGSIDALS
jgi:hypothetical protein